MKKLKSSVVEKLKSSIRLSTFQLFTLSTAFATPLQWTCDWPEARSQAFSLYQGETATFEPTFRVNGHVVTNATIEAVWYQTNGMNNAWWRLDNATFAPSNDVGAAAYRFFVEARVSSSSEFELENGTVNSPTPTQNSNSILYRANGTLRMLPSPGFEPNALPLPVQFLDFAAVSVANPPWEEGIATNAAEIAALAAATNSYLTAESDPTVPSWAKAAQKPSYSYGEITGTPTAWPYTSITNAPWVASLAPATNYTQSVAAGLSVAIATNAADIVAVDARAEAGRVWVDWHDSVSDNEQAAGYSAIYFKPSVFGMSDGAAIKSFTIKTSGNTGGLPSGAVYAKFIDPDSTAAAMGVSHPVSLTSGNTVYKFEFDKAVAFATATKQYRLVFYSGAPDGSPQVTVALRLHLMASATDLYFGAGKTTWRPTMTVQWGGLIREEDPTVPSWAKAEQKPSYTASEVGAATAEDVYRLVAGTNVLLVVTNYNSSVHAPSMKLQHLDAESGEYVTYWDETRRHAMTLTNAMQYADAQVATRAPKAWSGTTSGLGQEAPEGFTWISTPKTAIAGGYEYEKVVTSAGAVWILSSNGLVSDATTNSFFRVSSADGTELFSIEKTDSYLVGVNPDGITRSGNTVTIPLNVVAAQHPYIRASTNIVDAVWVKEDENGFSCPWASVSWSGTAGAYVATVTCAQPSAFFYFEYTVEGSAKVKNTAATELSGGIYFNGNLYMPTVSGNELKFTRQQ